MKKLFTILYNEFQTELVSLINKSGLPYQVIADILGQVLPEIRRGAAAQLEADRRAYEEAINKESKEESAQKPKKTVQSPADIKGTVETLNEFYGGDKADGNTEQTG